MANPSFESVTPPFINFRFEVAIIPADLPGLSGPICDAAFAECSGLEMTMEPKSFTQLGNHQQQTHLIGSVTYGRLTLRRGMTPNTDLWRWFDFAITPGQKTSAEAQINVMQADGSPAFGFILSNCLPVRLSGPSLNAGNGEVAIEEMQLVYEHMRLRDLDSRTGDQGVSGSFNQGFSVSAGGSVSGGAAGGFSGGARGSVSGSLGGGLSVGGSSRSSNSFSF